LALARPRLASRPEIGARLDAAVRTGHLPAKDTALASTGLHERWADRWRRKISKLRDAAQTVTL
jgi:hypothetical protein